MGLSNLRTNLERKFSDWLGERESIEKDIQEIEAAYTTLDAKRERLESVELLLKSTKVIMTEIAPTWNPASIKPSRKNASKLPFDSGVVTRSAFDVMRQENRPMTAREIAKIVVEQKGFDAEDGDLVTRVKTAIDASLRAKDGKFVEGSKGYGKKWTIIQGDRPDPSGQSDS